LIVQFKNGSVHSSFNLHSPATARLVRGGQSFENLGVVGNLASVKFSAENLPDRAYQVGTASKTWTFSNGSTAITGLKAVPVTGKTDAGLGITATEVVLGDIAANASFTVTLPIAPEHAGLPIKSSYWKLVDGSGAAVKISNSKTGEFWLKLRTNQAPVFSARQAAVLGAKVGSTVQMTLLGEDADGDALTYSVISGGGSVVGNVWSGSFADTGVNNLHELVLGVSDGMETSQKTIKAVVYDGSGLTDFFADIAPSTNPNSLYAAAHFLVGKGIVLGCKALASGQRIFCYGDKVSQAEALKMLLLAAKERGLVTLDAPYAFANSNMTVLDVAGAGLLDYAWSATYAVTALRLGMLSDLGNWDPAAPVTRLQLAHWLNRLLNLSVPIALLESHSLLDTYTLQDVADFANEVDYADARRVAFYGYMGAMGGTFAPATEMTRGDFALVAARLLRTPKVTGLKLSAAGAALTQTPPSPASMTHGQTLSIEGVNGLSISEILMSGTRVLEDWIEPVPNYVQIGVALSDGRSLGAARFVKDLATSPITFDTSELNLRSSQTVTLIVMLISQAPTTADMVRSGVGSILLVPVVVNFPDRDGDGVRDDLDPWPDTALFSIDANANGIPDNVDAAFNLTARSGSDMVTINGTPTLIAQALGAGQFQELAAAVGGTAAGGVSVGGVAYTPGGSLTLDFALGWNLSGNGSDTPIDVTTTFANATQVTSVWKWLPSPLSKWGFYSPNLTGQALTDYQASKGYAALTSIGAGEGFWVNAKQPFTATVTGGYAVTAAQFGAKLVSGWSLVSLGEEPQSPSLFNSTLGYDLTSLWAWDNPLSQWYFYAPTLANSGALANYITGKGYLDFTQQGKALGWGTGFWVNKP